MSEEITQPANDVVDLTKARDLNIPKGIIKITVEVMMPRPENPEVGDQVACQPMYFNIAKNRDFKHIPVEVMPAIRTIIAQMVELARRHTHAPMVPKIEQIEKPTGPLQAELYRRNMVTGELVQVGEPTLLDKNFEPIAKLEV